LNWGIACPYSMIYLKQCWWNFFHIVVSFATLARYPFFVWPRLEGVLWGNQRDVPLWPVRARPSSSSPRIFLLFELAMQNQVTERPTFYFSPPFQVKKRVHFRFSSGLTSMISHGAPGASPFFFMAVPTNMRVANLEVVFTAQ